MKGAKGEIKQKGETQREGEIKLRRMKQQTPRRGTGVTVCGLCSLQTPR